MRKELMRHALLLLPALLAIACSDPGAPPVSTPSIVGDWQMDSFDGAKVPRTYVEFFDEPVGDSIIGHVIIRLDSAVKRITADSLYQRRYYFSEIHDGVVMFRYLWGDHGKLSVGDSFTLTLTSEYIENLTSAGRITLAGAIELSEELWLGEEKRSTIWLRRSAGG